MNLYIKVILTFVVLLVGSPPHGTFNTDSEKWVGVHCTEVVALSAVTCRCISVYPFGDKMRD